MSCSRAFVLGPRAVLGEALALGGILPKEISLTHLCFHSFIHHLCVSLWISHFLRCSLLCLHLYPQSLGA